MTVAVALVLMIVLLVTPLPEIAWDFITKRRRDRSYREYVERVSKP